MSKEERRGGFFFSRDDYAEDCPSSEYGVLLVTNTKSTRGPTFSAVRMSKYHLEGFSYSRTVGTYRPTYSTDFTECLLG